MCGIAGIWNPVGDLREVVTKATDALSHRGPDSSGYYLAEEHQLALGHRRLAVVDLTESASQPMTSSCGRYVISFNGEVYNFRSLRAELEESGVTFRGSSDTEVMLGCISRWGIRTAVERFAGMFAFALWDKDEQALWLARDRMGEKPIYYATLGNTFAWASELKSLRTLANPPSRINPAAIADVLARGYVRGSHSVYEEVSRLMPGSILKVQRSDGGYTASVSRYWSISDALESSRDSGSAALADGDAVELFDSLLSQVVDDESVADVPLGAFLSGGIDSSLIVAMMQKVGARKTRTFTIALDDQRFDESRHAQAVADYLGTDHTEVHFSSADLLRLFDRLPQIYDEPFADSSALPTLLVSSATREHVTVALSGDGGDELFGGYSQYTGKDTVGALAQRIPAALRGMARAFALLSPTAAYGALSSDQWPANTRERVQISLQPRSTREYYEALHSAWVAPALIMAAGLQGTAGSPRLEVSWPLQVTHPEAQMAYDMQTYLPDDILVKVDRAAMAFSLETRAPLLDHRVVEFALGQPLKRKIRDGQGKQLMRQLLARYVPTELWDRPKQGFAIPVGEWLRTDLRAQAEALLVNDEVLKTWFRSEVLQRVWQEHQSGADHSGRLWRVLVVLQWLRSQ